MLNIISKENLNKLLPLFSKKQYTEGIKLGSQSIDFKSAEDYLEYLVSTFDSTIYPEPIEDQIVASISLNAFDFNKDNNLFKIFYQSYLEPSDEFLPPSIILYDIQNEFKLIINDKEILITSPFWRIEYEYNKINKLGYWLEGLYIDLMYIFQDNLLTSIKKISD